MATLEKTKLTGTEMGKLWATYVSNTMAICVLAHYLKLVDDTKIKQILEYAFGLCKDIIGEIETIFNEADFPIPLGFTDRDVNLEAPRLFQDEFYLHYLQYSGKAGMSIYSVAIPLVTRKDIREFYTRILNDTIKLAAAVNDTLALKGQLMNDPVIPSPSKVRFVHNQSFLKGFFGDVRPLHGLEIAHLTGAIHNDVAYYRL
ncbi:DUF3231 family protein [Paenibacillus thermotolerans]|uniref:DUF3231 family protein n=1 Tax=Paenibacillus thermotolerans TaxID=3027807 RepID=UPI00236843C2|nr:MULTISPECIES: DUF3231 family protein [unclassified Paenibacillus]